jgi:uncharacterized protein (TIGR02594 family)
VTYNRAILDAAGQYLGLAEWPGAKNNPEIVKMFADVGHEQGDSTAWCAAYVGSVLASLGLPHTGKLNARSYATYGTEVSVQNALPGDIVVFWRGSPDSWQGHVAFLVRFEGQSVIVRGGNQGNAVSDAAYPTSRIVAIRRADGRAAEPTRPTLRFGDKGAFVLDLQDQLERLGYVLGKVDGHFGDRTEEAVVAFQRVNGLTVDGIAGPATWAALAKAEPRPHRDITADDLKGSRTIEAANRVSTAAGATVGVAGLGTVVEAVSYVRQLGDVEGTLALLQRLLMAYWPALVVVVLGLVIWRYAERIKAVRIDDAITGRNLGR